LRIEEKQMPFVCAWHHISSLPSWQACDAEKKERSHGAALRMQKVSTVVRSRGWRLAVILVIHA